MAPFSWLDWGGEDRREDEEGGEEDGDGGHR